MRQKSIEADTVLRKLSDIRLKIGDLELIAFTEKVIVT